MTSGTSSTLCHCRIPNRQTRESFVIFLLSRNDNISFLSNGPTGKPSITAYHSCVDAESFSEDRKLVIEPGTDIFDIATFIDSIIFVANVESMPKLISFWIDEKSEDCIFGHFIGGTGGKGGGTALSEVNKRLNPVSLAIAHCSIP